MERALSIHVRRGVLPKKVLQELGKVAHNLVPVMGKGVPLGAWSEKDQQLMEKGEKPRGYPEHPNI